MEPGVSNGEGVRLLLLPGMDGTEILFGPLRRSLPGHLDVEALRYPQRGPSDYSLLLTNALAAIDAAPPETRFVVLGWSFGGPLAMRVARLRPSRVHALVLVSTFVSCPLPWLRRVRWLLIGPIVGAVRFVRRLPLWLLRKPSDPLRRDKAELWRTVPAAALAARAREVASVDARADLAACQQPALCIVAHSDSVVPAACAEQIVRLLPHAQVLTLRGGHFALYTEAQAAADAIAEFVASRIRATGGDGAQSA